MDISWSANTTTTRVLASIQNQLTQLTAKVNTIMSALDNLQAADAALKTEVATAIADWAATLATAGADNPAIQAVADDMNAQAAALAGADPVTAPPA